MGTGFKVADLHGELTLDRAKFDRALDDTKRRATKRMQEINRAMQDGSRAGSNAFVAAMQKNRFALQQLSFGAQDFVTVMSMPGMGLNAALRASSNNLAQTLSLMSPMAGAFGGLAVVLATTLVPHYLDRPKPRKISMMN